MGGIPILIEQSPPGPAGTRPPLLVLLVEDDSGVRSALAAILHHQGYSVLAAANGFDALVSLEQNRPDLVVLDWMMPVLDGRNFVRALREEYLLPIPVLVISAGNISERTALEAGADGFLSKPFDIDKLVECVEHLASRRERQDNSQ